MRWFILLLLVLAGCTHETIRVETSLEREERLLQFGASELPLHAKKVMDCGNGWYTFELETYGKQRVFLFHRKADYSGESSWGLESITELSIDEFSD